MTFSMLPQSEARMTANNGNNLSKMLRQRSLSLSLTLRELAAKSGVPASYLGHVERAKRFPSAHVPQKSLSLLNTTLGSYNIWSSSFLS